MNKNGKNGFSTFVKVLVIFFGIIFFISCVNSFLGIDEITDKEDYVYDKEALNIISSSENEVLDSSIKYVAKKNGIKLNIVYADTLDIISYLNNGEKYDAVWSANSIWNYKLNKNVSLSESKSMSINPVIFGIKKSKAEELGFVGKDIKTKDILDAIKEGKLKFSMSNPNSTNSGALAYLGILSTLAGNPDILTLDMLNSDKLKNDMKTFFTGLERTSGDEDYLEELFINGDYDAVISYESSIININKQLKNNNKETLYAIYPIDGVSISDSIFALVNNKDDKKKEDFLIIQNYYLSSSGQKELEEIGRRTWYGGTTDQARKDIFNPEWGIDTTKMISPLKYPSDAVIDRALELYQEELRKPIHVVFCLDYSGSMYGDGYEELVKAMEYILDSKQASKDSIQFTSKDKIDILPFASDVKDAWSTDNGAMTTTLINNIKSHSPGGATALYSATIKALEMLEKETGNTYNRSIILMTDGDPNENKSFYDLKRRYNDLNSKIPIFAITFGDATDYYLDDIAKLSNAKVFDGKTNLVEAFKEVREYN